MHEMRSGRLCISPSMISSLGLVGPLRSSGVGRSDRAALRDRNIKADVSLSNPRLLAMRRRNLTYRMSLPAEAQRVAGREGRWGDRPLQIDDGSRQCEEPASTKIREGR